MIRPQFLFTLSVPKGLIYTRKKESLESDNCKWSKMAIEVGRFSEPSNSPNKGGYLLAAGALVGYKRFDLAVMACKALGRKLIVAGDGAEEQKLRQLSGNTTEFVIAPDQKRWVELLRGADALLFPGVEDVGMVAIEAMASGTPVIAFRAGGALDFIKEGITGVFFDEPTADSLGAAIERARTISWSANKLRDFAAGFETKKFQEKVRLQLDKLLHEQR